MNRGLVGLLCCLPPLLLAMAGSVGAQAEGDYLTCYNFTWTGRNTSVDCEEHLVDIMNEAQPCLHTLVYTVPPNLPPNMTDLKRHCSSVAKCPPYTCTTKNQQCIQISWYDITNTLVNYSSFCGVVTDVTDPAKKRAVENVVLEMEVGTYTKKLKVCDIHLCNAAGPLLASGTLAAAATVLVLVLSVAADERGHG